MSEITLFNFEGAQVRVSLDSKGSPWFVAKDICDAFEHSDVSVLVSRLDEDEKGTSTVCTPGGTQQMLSVSESGLYSIILTSRKPNAKRFKKWVTAEVLPTIRKTGSYSRSSIPAETALSLQQDTERKTILETAKFLQDTVPGIRPELAAACTMRALTACHLLPKSGHEELRNMLSVEVEQAPQLTPTQIGEQLGGISPKLVNKMLEARGLQKKRGKKWEPTEDGKEYAGAVAYQAENSKHQGYQVKWSAEIVELLQEPLEEPSKSKLLT